MRDIDKFLIQLKEEYQKEQGKFEYRLAVLRGKTKVIKLYR